MIVEDRIQARLAELEQAERETETRLIIIRNLIVELRGLLQPVAAEEESEGINHA